MATGNFSISADPKDVERLLYKLQALENVESREPVKQAFQKGGDELKAKATASIISHGFIKTGKFAQSPSRQFRKKKNNPGVLVGFRRGGFHGQVAHLMAGTKERFTKSGAYRGKIKESSYWSDISQTDAPRVLQDIMKAIENEIDRILLK